MIDSPFVWFGLLVLIMIVGFLIPSILRNVKINRELDRLGLAPLDDVRAFDERLDSLISGYYGRNGQFVERANYTLISFQLMEYDPGEADIQHGQYMAVISPRLNLPRFTLQSPVKGPQMIAGLVNRLEQHRLSLIQLPEFENLDGWYQVYGRDQSEVWPVLTDRVRAALIAEAQVSTLHAGGDMLIFSISMEGSYTKPDRKIAADELVGMLVNQADFLFNLFGQDK